MFLQSFKHDPKMFGPAWQLLRFEAREFIMNFMHKDSTKRLTPAQGLKHSWIQKFKQQRRSERIARRNSQESSLVQLPASLYARYYQPARKSSMHDFALWVGRNLGKHTLQSIRVPAELHILQVVRRGTPGEQGLLGMLPLRANLN